MAERSAAARDRVRCHPGWSPPRLPTQEMSRNLRRTCARTLRPRLLDLARRICRSPARRRHGVLEEGVLVPQVSSAAPGTLRANVHECHRAHAD
eukprot:scaffold4870_cov60-Phaeocystis_antarctica.AAC.4